MHTCTRTHTHTRTHTNAGTHTRTHTHTHSHCPDVHMNKHTSVTDLTGRDMHGTILRTQYAPALRRTVRTAVQHALQNQLSHRY